MSKGFAYESLRRKRKSLNAAIAAFTVNLVAVYAAMVAVNVMQ